MLSQVVLTSMQRIVVDRMIVLSGYLARCRLPSMHLAKATYQWARNSSRACILDFVEVDLRAFWIQK